MTEDQRKHSADFIAAVARMTTELHEAIEEIKLLMGDLHEKVLGTDSDKIIGELNHRIKVRVEKRLLEVEQKSAVFAAAMDDLGRPGDRPPHQQ